MHEEECLKEIKIGSPAVCFSLFISGEPYLTSLAFFLHIHAGNRIEGDVVMRIHKDNLRHLPRFPEVYPRPGRRGHA